MKKANKEHLLQFLQNKKRLRNRPIEEDFFIETLTKYLQEYIDQYHSLTPFDFNVGDWVYVVKKNHNGKYYVNTGTINHRTDHGKGKVTYGVLGLNLSADRIFHNQDEAELYSDKLNNFI